MNRQIYRTRTFAMWAAAGNPAIRRGSPGRKQKDRVMREGFEVEATTRIELV
jgi:hypothetical protein